MLTRISFPVLTVAAAGSVFIACGSPDRIFVPEDSGGTPPVDSSPRVDATPDTPAVADQQSEPRPDLPTSMDAPTPEASTDVRLDVASDVRVDANDGGTLDGGVQDMRSGDPILADMGVNDVAINDIVNGDTVNDGGAIDGTTDDVNADILDCSSMPTPRISPSGSTGFCPGKSVTLTSTSAASYLWSTAATTQAIDVNAAGSYTVTTYDGRGCMATSVPTVVSAYPTPTATISTSGTTRLCPGTSVTLTASTASTYLWSTGATTQSISVNAADSYYVTTTDANGCQATSASTPVTVAPPPTPGTRTHYFTGAPDSFVVPDCVFSINVNAYGAQGGSSNSMGIGGKGGQLSASLAVTPGAVLQIRVGGAGTLCSADNAGGWNGGGSANCAGTAGGPGMIYSATGGGASDVRVAPYGLDDRVLVVGGGGGAGYNCGSVQDSGGVGGGETGGTFPTTCGGHPESAGVGGSQTAGGIGGTYPGYGYAGSGAFGLGGTGVSTGGSMAYQGGGGGGGYFGAGGGCWVGGGGGSSYVRSSIVIGMPAHTPGGATGGGHGTLTLSWP